MNKRERSVTIERGEAWGEWKDRPAHGLGFSGQSPIFRMMKYQVPIDGVYQDLCPEYSYSEYNKRTDRIIHLMPDLYRAVAFFEWCGKNGSHEAKAQELRDIARRFGLVDDDQKINTRKLYDSKQRMIFFLYAALKAGACKSAA